MNSIGIKVENLSKVFSFDKPEGDKVYDTIMKILEHAKKNNIIAGIHNMKY